MRRSASVSLSRACYQIRIAKPDPDGLSDIAKATLDYRTNRNKAYSGGGAEEADVSKQGVQTEYDPIG